VFTVETGVGVVGANSYISLAAALSSHADRLNTAWADATTPEREAALVRASAALDGKYGPLWPGIRSSETQGLDWPRDEAYDRDGYELTLVPAGVLAATCEAALVELGEAGALTKKSDAGLRRQKIGAIEQEWSGSSGDTIYPAIARSLGKIIKSGNTMARR